MTSSSGFDDDDDDPRRKEPTMTQGSTATENVATDNLEDFAEWRYEKAAARVVAVIEALRSLAAGVAPRARPAEPPPKRPATILPFPLIMGMATGAVVRERACARCAYYRPPVPDDFELLPGPPIGECRRRPPGARGWPDVKETDWCGSFEPDPTLQ